MTFGVASELKQRYPDCEVYLLSARDARRPDDEKHNLKFSILPWDIRMKLRFFWFLKPVIKNKYFSSSEEKDMWLVAKEADLVIDVSGFCLSSQFPKLNVINYLLNLWLFKKFKVPVVLFPQSFGPFNFEGMGTSLILKAISRYLKYPAKIYAREQHGKDMLSKMGIHSNVTTSLDSVIRLNKVVPSNIWYEQPEFNLPEISAGSIGIIPNQKVITNNNGNHVYELYNKVIDRFLLKNKKIYLLRHSFEDLEILERIKQSYQNEPRVVVLGDDYDSQTLLHIISKFDFVIASRYHATVHALKCSVPAIVLGWAVKYEELMESFNLLDFCFDVRQTIEVSNFMQQLEFMENKHSSISHDIKQQMNSLADNKLFDEAIKSVK